MLTDNNMVEGTAQAASNSRSQTADPTAGLNMSSSWSYFFRITPIVPNNQIMYAFCRNFLAILVCLDNLQMTDLHVYF